MRKAGVLVDPSMKHTAQSLPQPKNKIAWRLVCVAFSIAFVLAGWYVTALVLNTPALPTPLEALGVCGQFAPVLANDFAISTYRIVIGMLIGTLCGLPVGLAIGRNTTLDNLFAPALYILYPIPKIVLLPILLVLMGLGGAPKIVLIALTVFFQVVVVMRDGAKSIPHQYFDIAATLGLGRTQKIRFVIVPATLKHLFTTLRVSTAVAIAVLFFAEAIAGSTGLGYFIMNAWAQVNYPRMFAGICAQAVLGVVLYEVFDIIERKLAV